jgi:xanthine/CO dehydrogenase XdhC/CoxF family maturation factor
MDWPFILKRLLEQQPCVLVTLNLILGSVPRESGSRMVVTASEVHGSIGGGNLEHSAIRQARQLLADSDSARQSHSPWGLGPALNQCCGGAVTLHFEVLPQGSPEWLDHLNTAVQEDAPAVLASAIDRHPPMHLLITDAPSSKLHLPPEIAQTCDALLASQAYSSPVQSMGQVPEHIVTVERAGETWWLEAVRSRRVPWSCLAPAMWAEVARLLERLPFAVTWPTIGQGLARRYFGQYCGQHGQYSWRQAGRAARGYTEDPAAEVALARQQHIRGDDPQPHLMQTSA